MVRKTRINRIPTDERGITERHAYLFDRYLFTNHNDDPLIIETQVCKQRGKATCLLTPFIDAVPLDYILTEGNNPQFVHTIHSQLIQRLDKQGYFRQRHWQRKRSMWEQWLSHRADRLLEIIRYPPAIDLDLKTILSEAIDTLIADDSPIPQGFFPRDLNPGNILVDKQNMIHVIDQTFMFGDPVIVPVKLTVGWRPLANTLTVSGAVQPNVQQLLESKDTIADLDRQMLAEVKGKYPDDLNFDQRYYAAMCVRHIAGISRICGESANTSLRPDMLKVVKTYLKKDYQMLENS